MVTALGKDSLPSSLEPGSENDAPSLALRIVGSLLTSASGDCAWWWRWEVIARAVADAKTHAQRSCSVCQPCLLTCFPLIDGLPDHGMYYWIPTEWHIAKRGPALRAMLLSHAPLPSEEVARPWYYWIPTEWYRETWSSLRAMLLAYAPSQANGKRIARELPLKIARSVSKVVITAIVPCSSNNGKGDPNNHDTNYWGR
ncbi:hypothetical protein CI102_836 [Trichoderma harzianum]|uniref:Uncharacterized protein n=1 Tax=Trichoderma harzianum CBS 226.95 TaxID=983964 RepID=A0A2T4AI76_TRIHA|nr:hypothetical protein M431DRAFT_385939 [Trichoderma harzianum CBS 226.95]PKK54098.1 hypothetical protein CI102_836 [Trichoderma harzianum]PTB56753.1 hypothetical protein M431DRAFT_385939 [Trichoderma harzianum CBS 226.95]